MTVDDVNFPSDGIVCSGWHFRGVGGAFAGAAGRPVVVMAHGFGGTKDAGLRPFAERISAAGIDVLAFDYRGFGASDGQPRQSISIKRQIRDYHAAIDAASSLPGVDASRVAIWGTSLSGGHVLHVAADRPDVAALIAMTPLTSGVAAGRASIGSRGVSTALRATALGVASRISMARGRGAKYMPLVSEPGGSGRSPSMAPSRVTPRWQDRRGGTRLTPRSASSWGLSAPRRRLRDCGADSWCR